MGHFSENQSEHRSLNSRFTTGSIRVEVQFTEQDGYANGALVILAFLTALSCSGWSAGMYITGKQSWTSSCEWIMENFQVFFSAFKLLMTVLHAVLTRSSSCCHSIAAGFGKSHWKLSPKCLVNVVWFWIFINTATCRCSWLPMSLSLSFDSGLEEILSNISRVAAAAGLLWMSVLFHQVQCLLLWK